ncbi:ornithine cyclodeaminase family protein [Dermacoccus abyssi]|uniref:ornithine cyclodeaminase family protein n=1 Tax=Dermacoccus abyssi TaxID=322596 RepID=UPI0021A6C849|nr:ornithine cyclodeaminase family protein [Dermacoccus abyssi]MCT1986300.1 ornithine cyclodeaminase family protein [Dermacoccus abyssi]
MLFLDADRIFSVMSPADAVNALSSALVAGFDPADDLSRVVNPIDKGQLLLMPSEVGTGIGIKVMTLGRDNPERGLPVIQGSYLMFDGDTLAPTAVLDGAALTTLRTPAVSVAGIRPALERFDGPRRLVVFGTGPQGTSHVDTLADVVSEPFADVTFVSRTPENVGDDVISRGSVVAAGSPELDAVLTRADVVVCATPAEEPLFSAGAVRSDVVVIAMGSHSPGAREVPGALMARAQVVVEDVETALREAGDVVLAIADGDLSRDDLLLMKDVVRGDAELDPSRPLVFKTVGMPWQDLAVAQVVLERATR